MAKVDVLLGLQWGDEGKGKVVDYLAPKYQVVARFQGGPNAGHTLEFDGIKHVLHQIPSGIFHPGILNVIGNGVVIDPITFQREITALEKMGVDSRKGLVLSNRAQLILPTHRLLDQALESNKGESKIGSTLRGIGPTYQDKIGRQGLRIGDITRSDFNQKYTSLKDIHLGQLERLGFDMSLVGPDDDFFAALEVVRSFQILNTEYLLNNALVEGKKILAEGAQGSLLDIDFGSYPFVTSSTTTASGACTGLGLAPGRIGRVFGIFKAYCTRVGSGPFPTELLGEAGETLRKRGNEFGATTGRPRRCGWLDMPALRYACMINGVTDLFMMKTDVLAGMDELLVAEAYQWEGHRSEELPFYYNAGELTPEYIKMEGWPQHKSDGFSDLPVSLKAYISHIEAKTGVPVTLVSYGPDRTETIFKN
jgi:adenylosuccinate synthase